MEIIYSTSVNVSAHFCQRTWAQSFKMTRSSVAMARVPCCNPYVLRPNADLLSTSTPACARRRTPFIDCKTETSSSWSMAGRIAPSFSNPGCNSQICTRDCIKAVVRSAISPLCTASCSTEAAAISSREQTTCWSRFGTPTLDVCWPP